MSEEQELLRFQRALEAIEGGDRHRPSRPAPGAALRFESTIEQDFMSHRAEQTGPLQRFSLLLSLLFYYGYYIADGLTFRSYSELWGWWLLLALCSPLNLLQLGLTFLPRQGGWIFHTAAAVFLVNALCIALISVVGYRDGLEIPAEVVVIQHLYGALLMGLPIRIAAPVVLIALTLFCALHGVSLGLGAEWFRRTFLLVTGDTMILAACFLQERAQRLSWIRSQVLRELSEHDPLTGLHNHRVFYQRGERVLQQARRDSHAVSLIALDLDHFKQFNDTHGHLAGDEALRQLATVLRRSARRPLDLTGRLGGEEFALLLYGADAEAAQQQARRLLDQIRALKMPAGTRPITASAGIATALPAGNDDHCLQSLVGLADAALYRAKDGGRDRVSL